MNLQYPVTESLFLEYQVPMKVGQVVSKKKGKIKQSEKIRNNTRNVLDEKYKMYVEESAKRMSEQEEYFELSIELVFSVKKLNSVPKPERFGKRKKARETKRFWQDYQYCVPSEEVQSDVNEKELNLLDLIRELEQADQAKDEKHKRDLYDLQLWVSGIKTFQKYCEIEKKEKYKAKMRKRAQRYMKSKQIAYQKFVEKVRKERGK